MDRMKGTATVKRINKSRQTDASRPGASTVLMPFILSILFILSKVLEKVALEIALVELAARLGLFR